MKCNGIGCSRRTSVSRPSFPRFVVDEAAVENLGVHIPGPLSLEIRTQRSRVNDSCLKYRGNQEPAQRESAGVGRGWGRGV